MRIAVAGAVVVAAALAGGLWHFRERSSRESEAQILADRRDLERLERRIEQVSSESREIDALLAKEPVLAKSQLSSTSNIDRSVARLQKRAALAGEHAQLLEQLDALAPAPAHGGLGPKRRRVAEAQIEFCDGLVGALRVLSHNDRAWKLENQGPVFVGDGAESVEFARRMHAAQRGAAKLAAALDALTAATPKP